MVPIGPPTPGQTNCHHLPFSLTSSRVTFTGQPEEAPRTEPNRHQRYIRPRDRLRILGGSEAGRCHRRVAKEKVHAAFRGNGFDPGSRLVYKHVKALALALVLAGVGSACIGSNGAHPGEEAERAATGEPAAGQRARLVLDQVWAGALYTEGFFSYVRLETTDGRVIVRREFRDSRTTQPLLRRWLSAGTYRVVSYQRGCVGSCPRGGHPGALDPALSRCAMTFEVQPGQRLVASVQVRPPLCVVVVGKRFEPSTARHWALAACRAGVPGHGVRGLADSVNARSTRPRDIAEGMAHELFPDFEPRIQRAAVGGCLRGLAIRSAR